MIEAEWNQIHSLRNDGDGLQTGPSKQKPKIVFDVELMPGESIVFEELELNYEHQLFFYPRFYCPTEVEILVANSAKAHEKLGWKPKVNFKELALNMMRADYDLLMKNK